MAWNGSGSFSRTNGTNTGTTVWQQDEAGAVDIEADRHDTHDQDLADGINACLAKNGENAMTGNLDLGGNSIVSLGAITGNGVDLTNADAILVLGSGSGQHLELDGDQIQSKSNATTAATLSINSLGGNLELGAQSGSGFTRLWQSGNAVLVSNATGIVVQSATNNDPTIQMLQDDGSTRNAYIQAQGTGTLIIENEVHGGSVTIQSEDSGGTVQTLFTSSPDGEFLLYRDGAVHLASDINGVTVRSDDAVKSVDIFSTNGSTQYGRLLHSGSGNYFGLIGTVASDLIRLYGTNSGSSTTLTIEGDPDGAATLYYAGSAKLATASGGVTVTGTMAATAVTVNGVALDEQISDVVGAMFSGNTETNITATYQDADNTIDLVVSDASESAKGVIEIATAAEAAAGSSNLLALTPGRFAGSKSLGATGYYTFPGGFTIQWGVTATITNATSGSDSFATAFTTVYAVTASPITSSLPGGGENMAVHTITTSGFQIRNQTGVNCTFQWVAMGIV